MPENLGTTELQFVRGHFRVRPICVIKAPTSSFQHRVSLFPDIFEPWGFVIIHATEWAGPLPPHLQSEPLLLVLLALFALPALNLLLLLLCRVDDPVDGQRGIKGPCLSWLKVIAVRTHGFSLEYLLSCLPATKPIHQEMGLFEFK